MPSMGASLIPRSNQGITVEVSSSEEDSLSNSMDSSSSDLVDDATISYKEGPLDEMSSLMVQLPLKRGLSKFYQGKSQSFTCLSGVRCLEDLVKLERPLKKKLKSSRSCGGDFDSHRSVQPKECSRVITKKSLRGCLFLDQCKEAPELLEQQASNPSTEG